MMQLQTQEKLDSLGRKLYDNVASGDLGNLNRQINDMGISAPKISLVKSIKNEIKEAASLLLGYIGLLYLVPKKLLIEPHPQFDTVYKRFDTRTQGTVLIPIFGSLAYYSGVDDVMALNPTLIPNTEENTAYISDAQRVIPILERVIASPYESEKTRRNAKRIREHLLETIRMCTDQSREGRIQALVHEMGHAITKMLDILDAETMIKEMVFGIYSIQRAAYEGFNTLLQVKATGVEIPKDWSYYPFYETASKALYNLFGYDDVGRIIREYAQKAVNALPRLGKEYFSEFVKLWKQKEMIEYNEGDQNSYTRKLGYDTSNIQEILELAA